jgi:hypothetical protein
MKRSPFVLVMLLALAGGDSCARHRAELAPPPHPAASAVQPAAGEEGTVDFVREVQPILEAGCRPCHFAGGQMYDELPFDQPETIHRLGTRLFTRIQDPTDQETLRRFLTAASQPAAGGAAAPNG